MLQIDTAGAPDAPMIIFLHGLGVSSWMWHEQVASLKQDFYCVTLDLPGNGASYRTMWTSFADTATQVAQVIREYSSSGKAHIVGLSLGGYVALYMLDQHPTVVESLIVSGVTTRPFTPRWVWKPVFKAMPHLLKFKPLVKLSAKAMQFPDEIVPLYVQDMERLSKTTIKRVYTELVDYQLPISLNSTSQRVLAVAGDCEAKQIRQCLADFPARLPHATAALVANAHHGWNGEHPEVFSIMTRNWIAGQSLPSQLAIV